MGGETSPLVRDSAEQAQPGASGFATTISRNIVASLARVLVVSLVALVLPAYLTHHLPVTTYAAWVLILQLGAYVSYLDLGIQTGVSKFVAEYDAKGDHAAAGRHASAGFAMMVAAGLVGAGLTAVLAWQVPRLFAAMPANLYHEVRVSLLLVGSSLSFGLVCAVYSAVFLGLQRYWIPMTLSIVNRVSYAAVVVSVVALQGNLTAMGLAVALINVATGSLQVIAWRRRASHVPLSIGMVKYGVLKDVARFCSLQSIWTIAMLCITGLDVVIVGHYDYIQTAYYSIATLPTSFVLLVVSSILNPLMPASSAMSTRCSGAEMGNLLARTTRYTTLLLLLTGLPLIVFGLPLLGMWVGSTYAFHTVRYLRILVFANIVRNLCAPYATMVVATGKQAPATTAAIAEAIINLGSSIYLASRFGAIGVAIGTVLGAFVSIALHFVLSMHFTYPTLTISRSRLFLNGLVRPAMSAIPSLVLIPLWWSPVHVGFTPRLAATWTVSTIAFAWYAGMNGNERHNLTQLFRTHFL